MSYYVGYLIGIAIMMLLAGVSWLIDKLENRRNSTCCDTHRGTRFSK